MAYLEAIILGLLQGLCEFLPVSSSGHLVLAQRMLGITEGTLLMTIMLHAGTLAAVFVVFWQDIWALIRRPFQKTTLLLIIATIPAAIGAFALGDALDTLFGGGFLGVSFLITSLLVFVIAKLPGSYGEATARDAAVMGLMQMVALAPGISRSGASIAGGVLSGLNRESATRFSFLMSIPAILGSLLLSVKDIIGVGMSGAGGPVLVGMVVAGITGYIAIRWMLSLIKSGSIVWFSLYTGALGLLVIGDQLFFHVFF